MSRTLKIDCHGDPVTIEVTDNGDMTFHNFDQEAEESAVELGFEPSICFVAWKALNDGKLDQLLIDYSKTGDAQEVKVLLFVGANVRAANDLALRWASERGHANVVRILLKAGADVRAANDLALRWASARGHPGVVKLLLKAGADVHATNDLALQVAAKNGHTDVVKILKAWIEEHG